LAIGPPFLQTRNIKDMAPSAPVHVVCGLIFHEGHVLATRRDPRRALPLFWEFPGGKLEQGESPEEALHRELEEELMLRVRINRALGPVTQRDESGHIRLIPFHCTVDQPFAPVPLDHGEIRWVRLEEARQLTWAPADIPLVDQLEDLFQS
jgi:8-oxo-dGTP diphosphatase